MTNDKQIEVSKKARELLSRIPQELLADKDLEFEISRSDLEIEGRPDAGEDEVYLNINISKGQPRAYIAFDFREGEDLAEFIQPGICDETGYCNKSDDLGLKDEESIKVCPHVASCDKVKNFIDTYMKTYKITAAEVKE